MKVEKEDVIPAAIVVGLLAWLLGIPQVVWARLGGKPLPASHIYVPSSIKRVTNPGNISIEALREETDHV